MTTETAAGRLVALCREGKFEEAQVELYASDAKSIEPENGAFPTVASLQEVIENGRKFRDSIAQVHRLQLSDPIVTGQVFAVTFLLDADFKGSGRAIFQEVCAFKVVDGKIVTAQYLY